MPEIQLEQSSKEWHTWRATKICATDSPVLAGVSPYKDARTLYFQKIGLAPQDKENIYMTWGKELEPLARAYFEEFTGKSVRPACFENGILGASLDGYNEEEKFIVEIKCNGAAIHKEFMNNKTIPEHHIWQMQHQLLCTGFDKAFYYSFDGRLGSILQVNADAQIQSKIMENAIAFKLRLDNLDPPDEKVETREDDITRDLIREYEFEKERSDIQELRLTEARQRLIDHAAGKSFQCKDVKVQWIAPTQYTDWNKINSEVLKDLKIDMSQYKKEKKGYWLVK